MNEKFNPSSFDSERIDTVANLPRHRLPDHVLDAVHTRIDTLGDAVIMRINRWATTIAAAILIVCSLLLVRQSLSVRSAQSYENILDSVAQMSVESKIDTTEDAQLAHWIISELHDQTLEPPEYPENAHE